MSGAPKTIIHGELYPDNVIIHESGAVVVDWESAGLGPGVLDIATLTQGHWESDLVEECEAPGQRTDKPGRECRVFAKHGPAAAPIRALIPQPVSP